MEAIDKILNFENSELIMSKKNIYGYQIRHNVQQITKTPVKCYICKKTIHAMDFYESIGALRMFYKGHKLVKQTQWRKTCGSCEGVKTIHKAWNKSIDEKKKKREQHEK